MSNLEHLVENGLICLEETKSYDQWYKKMCEDPNWTPFVGITIDDLWTFCQYVEYSYIPYLRDEIDELREKVYGGQQCLKQNELIMET